jgi:CheY-like chemotaxis protein
VESSDTELEQGTGLGLAIVARIVRNMNGQLRAESEVGRGSKFTFAFSFPLPTPAQIAAFIEASSATPQPENNSLTYSAPLSPVRDRPPNARRHSNDSIRSRGSNASGRSEIDQLVEMIASPSVEDMSRRNSGARQMKRRNSPREERNSIDRGEYQVQDSGTPIRSVKVDEDDVEVPAAGYTPPSLLAKKFGVSPTLEYKPEFLHVLVAEDDPVNRAIVKKRLEMDGHSITLTQNGSEAVDAFANIWKQCDIILMDLQVRATIACLIF